MTASGLMKIPEAAAYIGVSDKTIRRYIAAKLIACTNISAGMQKPHWAIHKKELDAFLEKRTQQPEYGELTLVTPPTQKVRKNTRYGYPTPPQGLAPNGLPNYRKAANPKRK